MVTVVRRPEPRLKRFLARWALKSSCFSSRGHFSWNSILNKLRPKCLVSGSFQLFPRSRLFLILVRSLGHNIRDGKLDRVEQALSKSASFFKRR